MKKTDQDCVIVAACRTPIGRIRGSLSGIRPDDLLAQAFRETLSRAQLNGDQLDEVVAGCTNQAGEDSRNVARFAAILAEIPFEIPAVTVNRLCSSGLEAVVHGSRMVRLGEASLVLTGGVESMTRAPWVVAKPAKGFTTGPMTTYDSTIGFRFPNSALAKHFPLESLGQTAENLAKEFSISRKAQDQFALNSHRKAVAAQKTGKFDAELIAFDGLDKDEGPRADTDFEKLSALKPAFQKGGTVTAGNSSSLNDGAAALLVASRKVARDKGSKILGRIIGSAVAGVHPNRMGIGPIPATEKLLKKSGISLCDIESVELNEAFASQSIACIQGLGLDEAIVNRWGGAIALGHPLGCSGARILTTLLSILEDEDQTLGLASLCVGIGQGMSLLVERE